ncbi:MAG: hypothetical protein KBG20_05100 [Caldilineaceae bacterium]|nr:hypothetical protein [Caldilineaceae bacterium]MBP8108261.1 hypothetical protein [Caldilineaceae bacterium]MBP8121648.1 hypothetical protein [Caldilineaceae bacterium]MBP9071652.1 hypothetical protein [Caldilineaceae bacterium]
MFSLGSGRSITKSRPPAVGRRWILVGLVLFLLYSVNFWGLSIMPFSQSSPINVLGVAMIHAAALNILASGAAWRGWRLVGALFAFLWGLTGVLPFVDVLILPQLLPNLPLSPMVAPQIYGGPLALLVNSGISAGVAAWVTARAFAKFGPADAQKHAPISFGPESWGRLLPLVIAGTALFGLLWGGLYVQLAGLEVQFSAGLFGVQAMRVLLWLLFTVPGLLMLQGQRTQISLLAGILYALFAGGVLLYPNGLPAAAQTALIIVTLTAALLFGWGVGWGIRRDA